MSYLGDLKGKVVLVTGASTGIGAAVALGFGRCGARVGVHYNASKAAAEQVAKDIKSAGGEAKLFQGDLKKTAAVEKLIADAVAAFGRIDVLVNNAGDLVRRTKIPDVDDAFFNDVIDLNVRAVVSACRFAIPQFRRQGGGNIINVGSNAARTGGGPGSGLYGSSKAFVQTLTRGLAKELAADKVRVNAVAPGLIDTPFHERHSTKQMLDGLLPTIPLGRLGTSEDCVGAFLFLASDSLSSYVTGQVIEVNGGSLMP